MRPSAPQRRPSYRLAAAAAKQRLSQQGFVAEVLTAECDERDARMRIRRVRQAKFPRTKRLADFDAARLPNLPASTLAHLVGGAWVDKGEPPVLLVIRAPARPAC